MANEVGVFNVPPVYVIGLMRLSESNGYSFERVVDPRLWVRNHRDAVMLLGVRSPADLDVVSELRSLEPDSLLVALIDQFGIEWIRQALIAGASGVVARDADVRQIALALEAAMDCSTIIPTDFAYQMAVRARDETPPYLSDAELTWLQSLAHCATVADIGEAAGYSEREIHRFWRDPGGVDVHLRAQSRRFGFPLSSFEFRTKRRHEIPARRPSDNLEALNPHMSRARNIPLSTTPYWRRPHR